MTSLDGLIDGAAEHAIRYRYKLWGYGEGPGLRATIAAATARARPELIDAVAEIVASGLVASGNEPDQEVDHLIPVEVLVALRGSGRRSAVALDVEPSIDRFVAAVADARRISPDRPPVHRPDHPTLGRLVWVDCMHTDGPGLIAAGRPDDAVGVIIESVRALQDESGLFSHGYRVDTGCTNGVHWARGQGWALYGLVGVLESVPDPELTDALRRLVDALIRFEHDGSWTTIVDDPDSPAEASLSPMVAATVTSAIRAGILTAAYRPLAARALAATLAAVRPDGALLVSAATPVGGPDTYYTAGSGVFPWGQGPLIDALLTAHRSERTIT